jgi:hypothetical protein
MAKGLMLPAMFISFSLLSREVWSSDNINIVNAVSDGIVTTNILNNDERSPMGCCRPIAPTDTGRPMLLVKDMSVSMNNDYIDLLFRKGKHKMVAAPT